MTFSNPITGGQGTLVRPAIKSPDYVPGVSGWSINRDGTVEFNNGTFRGTITAAEIVGAVFASSLTNPAIWINQDDANSMRVYGADGTLLVEIGANVGSLGSCVFYDQPNNRAVDIGVEIQWNTAPSGGLFTPFVSLYPTANGLLFNTQLTSGIALDVPHGAWVRLEAGSDNFETWNVVGAASQPAYGTNFASASTAGNYQALQFRMDAEDNLHIEGSFHCVNAITSALVFTLPSNYRPKVARNINVASDTSAAAVSTLGLLLQINSNGPVNLHASAATAVGQNFYVNAVIPMGDIA